MRALARAAAATSWRRSVPPFIRSTTAGKSRSAGVSCIRATRGSIGPNVKRCRLPVGQGGRRQAQVLGERRPHAGDQHAPAHVREKLTTAIAIHGLSPRRDVTVKTRFDPSSSNITTRLTSPLLLTRASLHAFVPAERQRADHLSRRGLTTRTRPESTSNVAGHDRHQHERSRAAPRGCGRCRGPGGG